jgi:aspartyl-tRNA(Asn)/glutamyl-tRNA(Gln) amidotransferase subunit B
MPYRPTIGLEVHAELKTATKMFCASKNDPDETRPNANVCPVCLAHPGTLPAINKQAVEHVLRVGSAIGGTLADFSEFDRKSYFYPDIPKGYQISQYEHPLVSGGELAGVHITRIHLEEDTARSSHHSTSLTTGATGHSLVDFNRAGVPLMELVTEPVIHDADTAGKFARELQQLLRSLGASDANLEKGEMRIEANISVSKDENFGTKVEVKNINSFRSVERAISYEVERQSKLLDEGGKVVQETRGWDDGKQSTFAQRLKEGSADYRYFPEPDLPKVLRSDMPEWSDEALRASLPELPAARRARYEALGVKSADADFFVREGVFGAFFEVVTQGSDAKRTALAANYIVSDLAGLRERDEVNAAWLADGANAARFASLIALVEAGELSSRGAKDVLAAMAAEAGEPRAIAESKGLLQVHDESALQRAVLGVIEANPAVAADYRAGKEAVLQFLVGQAMKATKGAGNPGKLRELLVAELKK